MPGGKGGGMGGKPAMGSGNPGGRSPGMGGGIPEERTEVTYARA